MKVVDYVSPNCDDTDLLIPRAHRHVGLEEQGPSGTAAATTMVTITDAQMYTAAQLVFLPIMLIINFALFQYLFVTYFSRRKEPRGMLLLASAVLGFVSLIPLAHKDEELVHHLNDISEACSTLTFLIQITIIGREGNRRVKILSIYRMTLVAELLVLAELAIILVDIAEVINPDISDMISKEVNQIVEDVSLVFIFVFRFYYLSLIHGFRKLLETKRAEIAVYLLFLTHEYPFLALEAATGVTWKYVQGAYNRIIIAACIWLTVKDKLKSRFSRTATTTNSQHKSQMNVSESVGPGAKTATLRGPSMAMAAAAAVAPAPTAHLS